MNINERTMVPLFAVLIASTAVTAAVFWLAGVSSKASAAQAQSIENKDDIKGLAKDIGEIRASQIRIETKLGIEVK